MTQQGNTGNEKRLIADTPPYPVDFLSTIVDSIADPLFVKDEQLAIVIDHPPLRPDLSEADVIDAGVTRRGATATATILEDFKTPLEGRKIEAKTDATPGSY
jgi:hypothetical protein